MGRGRVIRRAGLVFLVWAIFPAGAGAQQPSLTPAEVEKYALDPSDPAVAKLEWHNFIKIEAKLIEPYYYGDGHARPDATVLRKLEALYANIVQSGENFDHSSRIRSFKREVPELVGLHTNYLYRSLAQQMEGGSKKDEFWERIIDDAGAGGGLNRNEDNRWGAKHRAIVRYFEDRYAALRGGQERISLEGFRTLLAEARRVFVANVAYVDNRVGGRVVMGEEFVSRVGLLEELDAHETQMWKELDSVPREDFIPRMAAAVRAQDLAKSAAAAAAIRVEQNPVDLAARATQIARRLQDWQTARRNQGVYRSGAYPIPEDIKQEIIDLEVQLVLREEARKSRPARPEPVAEPGTKVARLTARHLYATLTVLGLATAWGSPKLAPHAISAAIVSTLLYVIHAVADAKLAKAAAKRLAEKQLAAQATPWPSNAWEDLLHEVDTHLKDTPPELREATGVLLAQLRRDPREVAGLPPESRMRIEVEPARIRVENSPGEREGEAIGVLGEPTAEAEVAKRLRFTRTPEGACLSEALKAMR